MEKINEWWLPAMQRRCMLIEIGQYNNTQEYTICPYPRYKKFKCDVIKWCHNTSSAWLVFVSLIWGYRVFLCIIMYFDVFWCIMLRHKVMSWYVISLVVFSIWDMGISCILVYYHVLWCILMHYVTS